MPPKTVKDKVFRFNIEKDIHLMDKAIQLNPFQLGKQKWEDIAKALKEEHGYNVKPSTCKDRVNHLLSMLEKQELSEKTGTEEERTERGRLLEDIRILIETDLGYLLTGP